MSKHKKKNNKVDTTPEAFKCKIKCPYKKMLGKTWGEVAQKYPWYIKSLMIYGLPVPDVIYDHFYNYTFGPNEKEMDRAAAAENFYAKKRYSTQKHNLK